MNSHRENKGLFVAILMLILGVCLVPPFFFMLAERAKKDTQVKNHAEDYNQICLSGHVYWYWEQGPLLAGKLNDDGTPVRCKND